MDGALNIGEVKNVTWLNGREFSDLQFEYWMRGLQGRGFKEEEADERKAKVGKRESGNGGTMRALAIVENGNSQHVTARAPGGVPLVRPTGAGGTPALPGDGEDRERATFLQRLADSPVEISDGELDFLSETMARPWGDWSEDQREAIDVLRDKYEGKV